MHFQDGHCVSQGSLEEQNWFNMYTYTYEKGTCLIGLYDEGLVVNNGGVHTGEDKRPGAAQFMNSVHSPLRSEVREVDSTAFSPASLNLGIWVSPTLGRIYSTPLAFSVNIPPAQLRGAS